ncbi:hypothetical protein ABN584_03905 [Gloeocapsa sp. BRSZ]
MNTLYIILSRNVLAQGRREISLTATLREYYTAFRSEYIRVSIHTGCLVDMKAIAVATL